MTRAQAETLVDQFVILISTLCVPCMLLGALWFAERGDLFGFSWFGFLALVSAHNCLAAIDRVRRRFRRSP